MICPCGSLRGLERCCGPIIAGDQPALTASDLMRSRYTAYATGERDYLIHSWSVATRPARLVLDPGTRWVGLDIIETDRGGALDTIAIVEFVAHYVDAEGPGERRERSRFERLDGRWVYLDAEV